MLPPRNAAGVIYNLAEIAPALAGLAATFHTIALIEQYVSGPWLVQHAYARFDLQVEVQRRPTPCSSSVPIFDPDRVRSPPSAPACRRLSPRKDRRSPSGHGTIRYVRRSFRTARGRGLRLVSRLRIHSGETLMLASVLLFAAELTLAAVVADLPHERAG